MRKQLSFKRSVWRSPLRIAGSLLGLLLLGCSQGPPNPANIRTASVAGSELRFDERYRDSIALDPPYSARTQRQRAIAHQLMRLDHAKEQAADHRAPKGQTYEEADPDGPYVVFLTPDARMADINR